MSLVIERCPNCGVEHELTHKGPCEVCGSDLRPWCRRHSKEIGWLSSPECPRCAAEAARGRRAPAPPPTRRTRTRPVPTRTVDRRPPRRDTGTVLREEATEWVPRIAIGGASLAVRFLQAAFVILRSMFVGALILGIAGAAYGYQLYGLTTSDGVAIHTLNREMLAVTALGVVAGGALGLLWGFVRALRILLASAE